MFGLEVLLPTTPAARVPSFRSRKDEILKAFRLFDDDETGKISFKNLKRVAKEMRYVKGLLPIRQPETTQREFGKDESNAAEFKLGS